MNGPEVSGEISQDYWKFFVGEGRPFVQHGLKGFFPLLPRSTVFLDPLQVVTHRTRVQQDVLARPIRKGTVVGDQIVQHDGKVFSADLRPLGNHGVHGCGPALPVHGLYLDAPHVVAVQTGLVDEPLAGFVLPGRGCSNKRAGDARACQKNPDSRFHETIIAETRLIM